MNLEKQSKMYDINKDEIDGIKKSKWTVFTDHIKREALQLGIEI